MLTAARKLKNTASPALALLPAMSAIDSGPDMFFSDTSPVTMCATIDTVNVHHFPGLLDARAATPRGRRSAAR